jgi:hypothetical protein
MITDEAKNCWEFWKCKEETRKKCPAYTSNPGSSCWAVAGSYSDYPGCPKINRDFEYCWECGWFKKINQGFRPIKI